MNRSSLGYFFAFLTALIWGMPSVLGKGVLGLINFQTLVLIQYFLGSLTVGSFLLIRRWSFKVKGKPNPTFLPKKSDLIPLAFGGILGQGAFSSLSFYSLSFISAPENGIIQALIPILILTIGVIFYGERFGKRQIASALFAFLGVALLIMGSGFELSSFNRGHGFCFLGVFLFSICAHDRERLCCFYDPLVTMFYQFVFAFFFACLSFSFLKEGFLDFPLLASNPKELAMVSFVGIGISGISYLIYGTSVRLIGASLSGMFLNLVPVSSFTLSVFFLDEAITSQKIFGIAIVSFSMLAFNFFKPKRPKKAPRPLPLKRTSYA